MTIQDKKIALIRMITELQDDQLIDGVSNYIKGNVKDFWHDLSDHEKLEIEIGLKQLDEGKSISLEDFLKKVS